MTTSNQRLQIAHLLEGRDDLMSPQAVADALGMKPNNVRYLLSEMLKDGQVSSPSRGLYGDVSGDLSAANNADDVSVNVSGDVSDGAKSRIPKPNGLRAFSLADGGMVSHAESLRRKGVDDAG
jgi:hypothetical protein